MNLFSQAFSTLFHSVHTKEKYSEQQFKPDGEKRKLSENKIPVQTQSRTNSLI
jgi:hypothetical protein